MRIVTCNTCGRVLGCSVGSGEGGKLGFRRKSVSQDEGVDIGAGTGVFATGGIIVEIDVFVPWESLDRRFV